MKYIEIHKTKTFKYKLKLSNLLKSNGGKTNGVLGTCIYLPWESGKGKAAGCMGWRKIPETGGEEKEKGILEEKMTILSKFLIFDKQPGIKKCSSCSGTGKIELSDKTSVGTAIFYGLVITTLVFSLMDMVGSTPNYFINVPLFVGSAILGMLTLAEYKEQINQPTVENKKWEKQL